MCHVPTGFEQSRLSTASCLFVILNNNFSFMMPLFLRGPYFFIHAPNLSNMLLTTFFNFSCLQCALWMLKPSFLITCSQNFSCFQLLLLVSLELLFYLEHLYLSHALSMVFLIFIGRTMSLLLQSFLNFWTKQLLLPYKVLHSRSVNFSNVIFLTGISNTQAT